MNPVLYETQKLWTPRSALQGQLPKLWVDANLITGLADGAAVTTWSDISGNGKNLTQSVAAAKPIFKVGIINGKPVVRFDGTDDILGNSSFFTLAQPFTIFMVAKHRGGNPGSGAVENFCGYFDESFGDAVRLGLYNNAGTVNFAIYNGSFVEDGLSNTNPHVFAGVYNGVSSVLAVDGVATTGNVGSGDGIEGHFGVGGALGSATGTATAPADVDVAEVIVYGVAIDATNRKKMQAYLGRKYGIGVV